MGTTYRARYTNGVLRPIGEVDLKEGEEVVFLRTDLVRAVLSEPADESGDGIRKTAGAWAGHTDWEEIKRILYEARDLGSRTPQSK